MKVLKFGGTSVGKPQRMREVASLVTREQGQKIVVLSALSGTTNALVKIGELIVAGNTKDASAEIEALYAHYLQFYQELLSNETCRGEAREIIDQHFDLIRSLLNIGFNDQYTKELLAQGELMSTKLFCKYLDEHGVDNILLPALEFMAIDEFDEPDMAHITSRLKSMLQNHQNDKIFITQGYICLNASQQIDNLKRGGSDYTASLIGAAINAEIVEIWTDIDGMHNNDPRVVNKTLPIAELSFNEASELAYFGAKILHPSSILPASKYNIPVQLKNTMDPQAFGTLISAEEHNSDVKAVAAKDGIIAIKIKSTRMLLAYGFLRKIFEVFEKYRTPIDMITTSEVAVSLTIDSESKLDEIVHELEQFGEVTVDKGQTIVCIVGNMIAEKRGIVKKIFNALDKVPVRMISYGGSKYNVSVLIDSSYKKEALSALNEGLFDLK